jgi:hypothetical protein
MNLGCTIATKQHHFAAAILTINVGDIRRSTSAASLVIVSIVDNFNNTSNNTVAAKDETPWPSVVRFPAADDPHVWTADLIVPPAQPHGYRHPRHWQHPQHAYESKTIVTRNYSPLSP